MSAFWQTVGVLTALSVCGAAALFAAVRGYDRLLSDLRSRREIAGVVFLFLALFVWASNKLFVVTERPTWLTVETSVNTNSWTEATVSWSSSAGIPADAVISIDVAVFGNATTNWQNRANVLFGAHSNVLSFASLSPSNPTNYICRIRSDYNPGFVEIVDLKALARDEVREVVCTWSNPTNIVGLAAIVQWREKRPAAPWVSAPPVILARTNAVTVSGNFVSRGVDREFRVLVPGYGSLSLTNLSDVQ